jgi:hypothetical protein
MGFSGHLVFARSERPLLEAPVFEGLEAELKDIASAWSARPGGWQTLQFEHGVWVDDHLAALAGWTGAPVCVADVSDSDLALVTGLGTDGRRWQAWLNLDNAAALLTDEPDDVDDMSLWISAPACDEAVGRKRAELEANVPADAVGALIWAAAAGVPAAAQQDRIEVLLRSRATFAEDLFEALLDELGFPRPDAPQ